MKKIALIILLCFFSIPIVAQLENPSLEEKDIKNDTAEITNLLNLSLQHRVNDISKAIATSKEAYDLAIILNDTNKIISSALRLSNNYSLVNKNRKALLQLYGALKYTENNLEGKAKLYTNIAGTYADLGDHESAVKNFETSLILAKEAELPILAFNINLGISYADIGEDEKALKIFLKNIENNDKENPIEYILLNYDFICSAYLKSKNYKDAFKYINIHHNLAKKHGNQYHILLSNNNYAAYYVLKTNYQRALLYSDSVLSIAKKIANSAILLDAYKMRSDIKYKLGSYKEAYGFHLLYSELSDSLNQIENFNLLEDVKLQFKYDEQVKLLGLERENSELFKSKSQTKILVLVLFIAAALLLVFIMTIYYRNKIKTAKFKSEAMTLKNESIQKELTSNILHLSKMNEFVNSISTNLKEKKKDLKPENVKSINNIIRNIQANTNNSIWNEFELHFEKVHSDFYNNVQTDFPNLTSNERKLCAFLKLNMSSKDISSITGQTSHSIVVARTRLRKKLGLSHTKENLTAFINKY